MYKILGPTERRILSQSRTGRWRESIPRKAQFLTGDQGRLRGRGLPGKLQGQQGGNSANKGEDHAHDSNDDAVFIPVSSLQRIRRGRCRGRMLGGLITLDCSESILRRCSRDRAGTLRSDRLSRKEFHGSTRCGRAARRISECWTLANKTRT
jgi:hypothetical protein